jgi:hypothetical protein
MDRRHVLRLSILGFPLAFLAPILTASGVLAAPEATTADSPFTLGTPTAATVTSYSPLIGDNGDFPSTTATIYNLFGASNTSVEANGDLIFGDNNPQPDLIDFTTPSPVQLIGLAVYLDSDDGNLDGPRSVGTFTFTADGAQVVNAPPTNESIAVANGLNVFMFANLVTASSFVATFSPNPNKDYTPDQYNDGAGPRVYELDGIPAPEPTCIGLVALGALCLLSRRRRSLPHPLNCAARHGTCSCA